MTKEKKLPDGVRAGSVTKDPDVKDPKHCPFCVVWEAEVIRLRAGNRKLLDKLKEEPMV